MKISKLLKKIFLATLFSSCFVSKKQLFDEKDISDKFRTLCYLMEKGSEKKYAVTKTKRRKQDTLKIIRWDLNKLDNKNYRKRGNHSFDQPRLCNFLGLDEIVYVDYGANGPDENDSIYIFTSYLFKTKEMPASVLFRRRIIHTKKDIKGLPKRILEKPEVGAFIFITPYGRYVLHPFKDPFYIDKRYKRIKKYSEILYLDYDHFYKSIVEKLTSKLNLNKKEIKKLSKKYL